jgi:hypothetical protein
VAADGPGEEEEEEEDSDGEQEQHGLEELGFEGPLSEVQEKYKDKLSAKLKQVRCASCRSFLHPGAQHMLLSHGPICQLITPAATTRTKNNSVQKRRPAAAYST